MAKPATEHTIEEVKEIFRAFLKKRKHRITPERFMILEEIYRGDGHFDADQIFRSMTDSAARVSRATVYNTLELLVDCGLVLRQQFGKNQSLYERAYSYQQHDHIICTECDHVIEFCDPRIHEIKTHMGKVYDMNISGHSLHLFGSCNNPESCKHKENKREEEKARLH